MVFSGSATLKKIESGNPVIYNKQLLQTIKDRCFYESLSIEEVEALSITLEQSKLNGSTAVKEHNQFVTRHATEHRRRVNNSLCPRCGGTLQTKQGKFGDFHSCENYPKCRYTKTIRSSKRSVEV